MSRILRGLGNSFVSVLRELDFDQNLNIKLAQT